MKLQKKHFISISVALLVVVISYFIFKYNQNRATSENVTEKNTVIINSDSQKIADIQVITLEPKELAHLITAPGEVIPNANLTTKMTIRVPAQIIKGYVQEGQHIKAGQPLVALSSVDMAKTQGDLLLAAQEWQRVKSLGKDAVSAKRYSEAQVDYQHAYSTVLAYGMTENEIDELLRSQKPSGAKGEFTLIAPRDGTIFNVNYTEGELIEPGRVLLQVVEEGTVWVDAKLPPDLVRTVKEGEIARVIIGNRSISGRVIQVHHQLDETTRTRSIRIEVPNTDDLLHPGQFVNCQIESGVTAPLLALPIDAVLKTVDGDWAIYVEKKPDHFQQVEIKINEVIDNQAVVQGVPAGTRVVIKGAFFIHSELNKTSFGDE